MSGNNLIFKCSIYENPKKVIKTCIFYFNCYFLEKLSMKKHQRIINSRNRAKKFLSTLVYGFMKKYTI